MKALLQGLGLVTAVAVCSPGMAVGPSSQSYAMPSSVLNAGIGPAAGAGHDIASSLGGPVATATVGAASARLHAGFQTAAYQPERSLPPRRRRSFRCSMARDALLLHWFP